MLGIDLPERLGDQSVDGLADQLVTLIGASNGAGVMDDVAGLSTATSGLCHILQ
jgi:hypothetical protein